RWELALAEGLELIEELEIPIESFYEIHSDLDTSKNKLDGTKSYKQLRDFYWNRTLAYLYGQLVFLLCGVGLGIMQGFARSAQHLRNLDDLYRMLFVVIFIFFFTCGAQLFRYWRLYIKFRDINKDIQDIGESLVSSFCEAN